MAAWRLATENRLDLNVLVDYAWPAFLADAPGFVRALDDDQARAGRCLVSVQGVGAGPPAACAAGAAGAARGGAVPSARRGAAARPASGLAGYRQRRSFMVAGVAGDQAPSACCAPAARGCAAPAGGKPETRQPAANTDQALKLFGLKED